ncbi:MAG TPA: polysaccharide pyruvyl transferase CsaB [Clostridiales bacterium]|nr:polysaccharide pyruvyl transferase CsaB [Clostridiales bacterium]
MKVAHLIGGGDVGGAKTHVLSLIAELSKEIDVTLISLREGQFAQEGRSMGLNIEVVDDKNPFTAIAKVRKILLEGKFDLIHCHGAKGNVMGTFLKPWHKRPVVTTVHSDYRRDYMGKPLKNLTNGLLNRLALRVVDYHIGVSDAFVDMLIKRGFPPHQIFTIYNGIDFTPYDRAEADDPTRRAAYLRSLGLNYNAGDIVVGIAARMHPVKDIGTLIEGFAKAAREEPKLKLVIAGDGEEREKLASIAKATGLADRICFAGWIREMGRFLTALDINTLTSLTESFPYSVLEGIRAGRATICSRVGGMPKLIDHGVNGFIFTPGDKDALAEYLLAFARDKEKRIEFSKKLAEKAAKLYSIEAMKNTQLAIYETICRRSSRPKTRRDRVILCGAYGRGNVGDDAIMEAITESLRSIDPDLDITVISRNPMKTRLEYRINTIHTFNFPLYAWRLFKTKLYINGGGTLIADNTSTRSIRYYLYSIWMAKLFGAKTMLYGCGIGPIRRPGNRKAAGRILNRHAHVITLRDDISMRELFLLGVTKPKMCLTADPALALSPADPSRIDAIFNEENAPAHVAYAGFSLRDWGKFRNSLDVVAEAAEYVYKKHGLTPLLFPMGYPADLDILEALSAKLTVPHVIFRQSHNAREVMGVISRMKLVFGMRLHSLVFAAAAGVPMVGLSYDVKVESFLKDMPHFPCIRLRGLSTSVLTDAIDKALSSSADSHAIEPKTLRSMQDARLANMEEAKNLLFS